MDISNEINTQDINAKEVAWELFKKSGNINYYRLYSDLKNEEESEL
jgi:hypothetical protein